jgi:hypothetical protein
MSVRLIRIKQHVVLAGLALTLSTVRPAPLHDGHETADPRAAEPAPTS